MPVMDGFTAAGKMRQKGVKSAIIAMTANAMKGDEKDCLAAGYSGYLPKPIDIDQFMELMADLVGGDQVPETDDASPGPLPMPENASAEKEKVPQRPLVSSLPTGNPEFQKIIIRFASQLRDKLKSAARARDRGDLAEMAAFAHWLKGAGGTVGFDEFTEPARQLEQLANAGADPSEMTAAWKAICRLTTRLAATTNDQAASSDARTGAEPPPAQMDTPASAHTAGTAVKPLISRFAELPEFKSIIHLFIETLDEKVSKMEQAYAQGDWEELAALSHWLKGSGGTVGFDAFTKPAAALEKFAKAQQVEPAGGMLDQVKRLKNATRPSDAGSGHAPEKASSI